MNMQHQARSNGQGNGQSGSTDNNPIDELELSSQLAQSSGGNPLLEQVNLGVGNYDEQFLWQQVRSYRKGLYAFIAFDGALTERAVHETKVKLAREGFAYYNKAKEDVEQWDAVDLDEDDVGLRESRRQLVLERGEEIWKSLGQEDTVLTQKQVAALIEKSGVSLDWLPVYWQMVSGRHEVSRSLDAELLRDVFTSINHLRNDADDDTAAKILGGIS